MERLIISTHEKGRNLERTLSDLYSLKVIPRKHFLRQFWVLHTRKKRVQGESNQQALLNGKLPLQNNPPYRLPSGTKVQEYVREGVDSKSCELRPIFNELNGVWKKTQVSVLGTRNEELSQVLSRFNPSNQVLFYGYDFILPALHKAGLLKKIPIHPSQYEESKTAQNPFILLGRFPEVSDDHSRYSCFSLLSKNKKVPNDLSQLKGTIGIRAEDQKLAKLLFAQNGLKPKIVSVKDPEEALSESKVDFSIAHVSSGKTAEKLGLSWQPLLYSSTVVLIHKNGLSNPKLTGLVDELKKRKLVVELKDRFLK